METVTVPRSVCIDGEWFAAHWAVQAVDGGSGELLITASAAGRDLVLRMGMDLVRDLRGQAGFDGPAAADEARAELAYWRESVEFAVKLLAKGRTAGQNIVTQSGHAEEYLRGLLALDGADEADGADGSDEATCYDCRTTGERIADLRRELAMQAQLMHGLANRLDALEAWQVAMAQDSVEDDTLFRIYDTVARRERALAAGGV